MKILGIDSSGLVASVAVVSDDIMIAEYTVNYKKTHSQTLLPMLDEIIKMASLDIKEIDAIAVAAGPGSFTGLRIGSSTAKGLGLALKKPLIAIPTLEGIAYNLFGTEKLICPMMDARRSQVYTALYEYQKGELETVTQPEAKSVEEVIIAVNELGRPVIYLGDGVEVYREPLINSTMTEYYFAPPHVSKQRAGAIAALGSIYYKKGIFETAADHKPIYLRESQAERERRERDGNSQNGTTGSGCSGSHRAKDL